MTDNGRADGLEVAKRTTSLMPRDYLTRRTEAFQKMLNRKGLPLTWGTGVPRSDKAWEQDHAPKKRGR